MSSALLFDIDSVYYDEFKKTTNSLIKGCDLYYCSPLREYLKDVNDDLYNKYPFMYKFLTDKEDENMSSMYLWCSDTEMSLLKEQLKRQRKAISKYIKESRKESESGLDPYIQEKKDIDIMLDQLTGIQQIALFLSLKANEVNVDSFEYKFCWA